MNTGDKKNLRILRFNCPHCKKDSALRIRELEEKDRRIAELEAEVERLLKKNVRQTFLETFLGG